MAKYTVHKVSFRADGKGYIPWYTDIIEINTEHSPRWDGIDLVNRGAVLELLNRWNAQAVKPREGVPMYVYWLAR